MVYVSYRKFKKCFKKEKRNRPGILYLAFQCLGSWGTRTTFVSSRPVLATVWYHFKRNEKLKRGEKKKLKEENRRNDLAGLGDPWVPEVAKPTVILFYPSQPVLFISYCCWAFYKWQIVRSLSALTWGGSVLPATESLWGEFCHTRIKWGCFVSLPQYHPPQSHEKILTSWGSCPRRYLGSLWQMLWPQSRLHSSVGDKRQGVVSTSLPRSQDRRSHPQADEKP